MRLGLKFYIILSAFVFRLSAEDIKKNAQLEININTKTEVLERGYLVGKRSVCTNVMGLVKGDRCGLYVSLDSIEPLQYKDSFSDRWKFSGGILKRLTDHFTWDLGCSYTFLQRDGFELLHHWKEWYAGIQSDLLMKPSWYFYWNSDKKQWCTELKFSYDFDLSLFDLKKIDLCWENFLGFFKGRRPYGKNKSNAKYHCFYCGTSFLLKYRVNECCFFYMGPTFAYNTGGVKRDSIVNAATHRSHFCHLNFGVEIVF